MTVKMRTAMRARERERVTVKMRAAMRARERERVTVKILCKRGIASVCVCVIMNCGDKIATMRGSKERRVRVWTRRTSRRACV